MIPDRLWREIDEALDDLAVWSRGEVPFTNAPERLDSSLVELRHEYRRMRRDHEHPDQQPAGPDRPVASFVAPGRFEAAFRGSTDEVSQRYADVADLLATHAPVLDIGAGRGEFLDLLRDRDIAARGCELDRELAREARARGHDVMHADGGAYLRECPAASVGAVVALQVIEHLGPGPLAEFVRESARVVRPGGTVFVDSPNPTVASVYARAFYADPTHTVPVHPETLADQFRNAGFAAVAIQGREPEPPLTRAPAALSNLLFGPNDYAVIATR